MSDSTTATIQAPPAPEKSKRSRSMINKELMAELLKSEKVVTAAEKYPDVLARREISGQKVGALKTNCSAVRAAFTQTQGSTTDTADATAAETTVLDALLEGMREAQVAAKQKYKNRGSAKLKDYYVGERLKGNRARVEQVSAAILEKLAPSDSGTAPDVLPGITPAKIATLSAARAAYINADKAYNDARTEALSGRIDLAAQMAQIAIDRRTIQYAAEAEWPARNPANAPIRREFQLPADRPFNG